MRVARNTGILTNTNDRRADMGSQAHTENQNTDTYRLQTEHRNLMAYRYKDTLPQLERGVDPAGTHDFC